jgi:hypothetical protein
MGLMPAHRLQLHWDQHGNAAGASRTCWLNGWGVALVAEYLPSKCKALSSNSSTTRKKKSCCGLNMKCSCRLMCGTLGLQLAFFWEDLETWGGGAYLEEVGHWECAFGGYNWSPILSCLPSREQCPPYASIAVMFCLTVGPESMEPRTMNQNLWDCEENKLFLL